MPQFYTLLTEIGRAKQANAIALKQPIEITQLAVGDGGGSLPTPEGDEEQLINEVRRASINTSDVDPDNPSWIVIEQVIPPDVGGWTIREIGIYDNAGDLIGYGNYPETYKPVLDEGSSRTQTVRFVLEVSDTAAITLKVDPSVVLATRKYADDGDEATSQAAADALQQHAESRNHPPATEAEQGMARVADQTTVNTGENDTRFVTAKKLKAWATQWVKQATETVAGMLKVATQAQVDAGNDDETAVTPKKLNGQMSTALEAVALTSLTKLLSPGRLDDAFKGENQSLAESGYQMLPGGLILQWASVVVTANSMASTSFPFEFPSEVIAHSQGTLYVGTGTNELNITLASIDTSGFTARTFRITGSANDDEKVTVIAIGY
ncbi:phage tail protein [Vreelandella janggokensis]|uniref:phage tail protein n=1 Tax=Vreelandella janggokensis TaxID=370767 RepID=UPI002863F7F2|nr:phage tail protein [Halomonas janggokensis]MDR5887565.1 phage tail protein [Halomonas janggokensis]